MHPCLKNTEAGDIIYCTHPFPERGEPGYSYYVLVPGAKRLECIDPDRDKGSLLNFEQTTLGAGHIELIRIVKAPK